MKCLGLVGSLTSPTLDVFWQTIRTETQKRLGTDRVPSLLVHCGNTPRLRNSFERADWRAITDDLLEDGRHLIKAGVDGLVICESALNPVVRGRPKPATRGHLKTRHFERG